MILPIGVKRSEPIQNHIEDILDMVFNSLVAIDEYNIYMVYTDKLKKK